MQTLLDADSIRQAAKTTSHHHFPDIQVFKELPSTNDYLLKQAMHFAKQTVACFAESQSAGKGRLGRAWVSPFGANLYLSLLWHFHLPLNELSGLNIIAGVSIIKSIQKMIGIDNLQLKWPNDVYHRDKKLAGILIEVASHSGNMSSVVIGIGINVNMPDEAAAQIQKPWTDLAGITGKSISRNDLAAALLDQLTINLEIFQKKGAAPFLPIWQSFDYLAGKHISIANGDTIIEGIAKGINKDGQLLLTHENKLIYINAGEASVTKLQSLSSSNINGSAKDLS